ncbi:hypothetical protein [Streptomyces sp. NPDC048659]
MDDLGGVLVKAGKWVVRGLVVFLDYVNLRDTVKGVRHEVRKARR